MRSGVRAATSQEIIEQKIFVLRGCKIMLDKELAKLYGVETGALNQAVKRNSKRFPKDFMFQLSRKEVKRVSQFVIPLKFSNRVYAFTEQGVAMLSSVLRSERAIRVNIAIMRAFVKLRKILSTHTKLARKLGLLERKIQSHDNQILAIFEAIRKLMSEPGKPQRQIGFHASH